MPDVISGVSDFFVSHSVKKINKTIIDAPDGFDFFSSSSALNVLCVMQLGFGVHNII